MTEQKLSLDEMIELAKEFNNKGKWRFEKTRNPKNFREVLETDKLDGVYMLFLRNNNEVTIKYSLHLLIDGRNSEDEIEVEEYFVEPNILPDNRPEFIFLDKEYEKLSKLYDEVKMGAYATQAEEQRQKNAEAPFRSALIEQRTREAVETARKLIGK